MWRMTRLAIVFYVSIIWCTSLAVILFVFHALDFNTVQQMLAVVYNDNKARAIVFDNPAGPVSVSLAALEDLIRRLSTQVPEVKEIRPTVLAIKKGLDIDIKLVLRTEANIPDLTARLQDLVRRKIEEAISLEGKINIRIHVVKISLEDIKGHKRPVHIDEPNVPFHGYRA